MKKKILLVLFNVTMAFCGLQPVSAQNTAFTYQGMLQTANGPATGHYDMVFRLYSVSSDGIPIATLPMMSPVPVTNGLFTTTLDFGSAPFDGSRRWLQIEVRTNNPSASFVTLSPRTELTPAPYAIHASTAAHANSAASISGPNPAFSGTAILSGLAGPSGLPGTPGDLILRSAPNPPLPGRNPPPPPPGTDAGDIFFQSSSGQQKGRIWTQSDPRGEALYLSAADNIADLTITDGKVGIGTTSPAGGLQVASGGLAVTGYSSPYSGSKGLYMETWDLGWGEGVGVLFAYDYFANAAMDLAINSPGGNVGIGTYAPQEKLHVAGGNLLVEGWGGEKAYLGGDGWGGDMQIGSMNPNVTSVSVYNPARPSSPWMNLTVGSLTILGGADLAEPFQMSHKDIPQGAVVVIDEDHPGQLKMSHRTYDTRVAGVVSGANGIKPGISLTQEGVLNVGENVALTGRVYVQADASEHPIKPGDLLTTSTVAGHAMKAADSARATGAILGKAMTALESGRGMVLVLVSLQ